jgi:small multidrug resistance family-3 protein
MSYLFAMSLLLVSALLEAGGDAVVRLGLHATSGVRRILLLASGGLILLIYACAVNAPPWAFGRLIGVYVVFFFLAAQAIGWFVFGEAPTAAVWIGGSLVVLGGLIVSSGGGLR